MKRNYIKSIYIISFILVVWMVLFITDYTRINQNEKPIFAVKISTYDDGGSEKYVGIFYTVYHVVFFENDEVVDYGFHMSTWFRSLDYIKKSLK